MVEDAQVSVLLTQAKLVEDRGWRMKMAILDLRFSILGFK